MRCLALAAAAALVALPAQAQDAQGPEWIFSISKEETGPTCFAEIDLDSGAQFFLHATLGVPGAKLVLADVFPDELVGDRTVPAAVDIDGTPHGMETRPDDDFVGIGLAPVDDALLEALAHGKAFTVEVAGRRSAEFPLEGSRDALTQFSLCMSPWGDGASAAPVAAAPAGDSLGGIALLQRNHPYREVRDALLESGWTAAATPEHLFDLDEAKFCVGSPADKCLLALGDTAGRALEVHTVGGEALMIESWTLTSPP